MSDRFLRGATSTARLMLSPFGNRSAWFHRSLGSAERLSRGLVLLLPGIDGCTSVCDNIARGLHAGKIAAAVEIHDWRRFRGWNPFHLATARHNRQRAEQICRRLLSYRSQFPNRPVHLIGHSAGAGMALFVLEALPGGFQVDTAILLAAAVSRRFAVRAQAASTRHGVWNFSSRLDVGAAGLGTLIFGTMDRRHAVSAGAWGFLNTTQSDEAGQSKPVHEVRYRREMVRSWNLGGHFGCTNSVFIETYIAPIISGDVRSIVDLQT